MSNPSVSVIIAVKNGERFLRDCLDSVLAQTFQPAEIIVIDGHSTDSTSTIAHSFPQVRYVLQAVPGLSAAYNQGIQAAGGELIAFISYDDLWTLDKLALQVNWMEARSDLVYTTARVKFFLEPGQPIPRGFRPELLEGNHEANIVTTPPAKAGGFLRSCPFQQRLLRLRLGYCPTLSPEGSIRADLVVAPSRFKFYERASPAQPAT